MGGGGSNATAVATVAGGAVTSITITDAGIGYTNTPSIIISPSLASALWPMVSQALALSLSSLSPYDNYQVEFTPVIGGGLERQRHAFHSHIHHEHPVRQ
jgi:hypothetical protein